MRDIVSIPRAKRLHPAISEEVIKIIDEVESEWPKTMAVRIVQGVRTEAEQWALYNQGRTTKGPIVTNAKPFQSFHCPYGLAIDFAILYDKDGNGVYETLSWDLSKDFNNNHEADWMEVVNAFVKKGYKWGADWDCDGKTKAQGDKDEKFVDNPHLEKSFGYTVKQLQVKYNNEDFIPDTKYVRI
jgi:peptidoglycan LD-endopeptidase CwlK